MTAPSPGGVQRWAITHTVCEQRIRTAPFEADDGDWVRYGDHVEVEKEADEDRAEAKGVIERFLEGERLDREKIRHLEAANAKLMEALEAFVRSGIPKDVSDEEDRP